MTWLARGLCVCLIGAAACGGGNNGEGNNGTNNDTNNGGTNNAGTNNGGTNNGGGDNNAQPQECSADNPLVESCGDLAFLGGCFEPDLTGTCTMTLSTEWSDGSKVERNTDGTGGFYGPGDTEPCGTFTYDMGTQTTTFERDGQTWTQVDNGDGTLTMTCPDGTTFDYTAADSEEYNACRGITCGPAGGGANNGGGVNNVGACTGAGDCPGTVCCETAVSTSCVPDEMTCGQVGGTVLP